MQDDDDDDSSSDDDGGVSVDETEKLWSSRIIKSYCCEPST